MSSQASQAAARSTSPGQRDAGPPVGGAGPEGPDGRSAEHALARAVHIVFAPIEKLIDLWRRSIQARVVIGTLALSAVLSMLAGWILLSRVADGLLESKRQAAISQTAAGRDTAPSAIVNADISNPLHPRAGLKTSIHELPPLGPP